MPWHRATARDAGSTHISSFQPRRPEPRSGETRFLQTFEHGGESVNRVAEHLVIENDGDSPVFGVAMEMTAGIRFVDDSPFPIELLSPKSAAYFQVYVYESRLVIPIAVTWRDAQGKEHRESLSVSWLRV